MLQEEKLGCRSVIPIEKTLALRQMAESSPRNYVPNRFSRFRNDQAGTDNGQNRTARAKASCFQVATVEHARKKHGSGHLNNNQWSCRYRQDVPGARFCTKMRPDGRLVQN